MIYFGNRDKMQWVKAPAVDYDASRIGWSNQMNYLNGGTSVRSSVSSHATAALGWNKMSAEEAQAILRPLRSGKLVYWVDPFATNQFPQSWAEPWRGAHDGQILDGSEVRPGLVPAISSTNGYPDEAARYVLTSATTDIRREVWLPIPPGYTLWVGVKGRVISGTPVVQSKADGGGVFNLPINTDTEVDYTSSFTGFPGVMFALRGNGTIELQSLQSELVRTGSPKPVHGFYPGEGMGGSLPVSEPSESRYSAVIGHANRAVSVNLVEVDAWL